MSLRIGSVTSPAHKLTAMQLLVKATTGSIEESTSAKSELVKSAVEQAACGNWELAAEYASAAYAAGIITPEELIEQISSSIVEQAQAPRSNEEPQAKTEGGGSASQAKGGKLAIPHLRELEPSFAAFVVREKLIELARGGNNNILTLFNRPSQKAAEQ